MDDIFYIDTKGATDIEVSTTNSAHEFRAVSTPKRQPKANKPTARKPRVINDDINETLLMATGAATSIKRLNSQFIELEVDKKPPRSRGKGRGKKKQGAAANKQKRKDVIDRSKPPPPPESDAELDEIADDYMQHLSDDDLEFLMGQSASFMSHDLGHKNGARGDALSSDELEADDPFRYEDRLTDMLLNKDSDVDDIDDDGFPYDIDMDELESGSESVVPNYLRHKTHQTSPSNSYPVLKQGRGKGKRNKDKQGGKEGPSSGFDPRLIIKRLDRLVYSNELDSLWLQPMNKYERQIVHILSREYKVKSKSHGNGHNRMPVLTPTPKSCRPTKRRRINRILMLFDQGGLIPEQWTGEQHNQYAGKDSSKRKGGKKNKGKQANTGVSPGKMVAENAPAVGASNIGHQMLQQMGWSPGQGLGAEQKGRATPVDVMIRNSRRGLGA
ncbi:squalene synthetase-like protein [Coemansia brasiliensis]|uniref:Squalene synthetase-like protein n=1 Tax=Coemansia brasiliensis TaxID=2650707 RepID=A0A9W8M2Y0_9FUNG|nr:squalene synthetase-like protein [Coemansia brasiliensis]